MNWIQRKFYNWFMRMIYKLIMRVFIPLFPPAIRRLIADEISQTPHIPQEHFDLLCARCGHPPYLHHPLGDGCRMRDCACRWDGKAPQNVSETL